MPFAPSNNFFNSFSTLKNIKQEKQFDIDKKTSIKEVVTNRAFLKKQHELDYDLNFNFKNVNNSKANQLKNNNLLFFKDFKTFTYLKSIIAIFSTSYAKEKLIKILNNNNLISK